MKTLSERLKYVLENSSLNAKSLSLRAGLNETAIGDILRGRSKNPRIDTLKKIAHALDVNHQWLLDGFGTIEIGGFDTPRLVAYDGIVDTMNAAREAISLYRLTLTEQGYAMLAEEIDNHILKNKINHNDLALYAPNNDYAPRFFYGDILLFDAIDDLQETSPHDIICYTSQNLEMCKIIEKKQLTVQKISGKIHRLSAIIFS